MGRQQLGANDTNMFGKLQVSSVRLKFRFNNAG